MQRRVLYALFTLSGMSALVYEVLWIRAFRLVFGSSTRSAGAVLAAFFLGMALGNLIGGRLSRRGNPIRRYGWTEILLGLTALLVGPWLMLYEGWFPPIYAWTGGDLRLLTAARLLLTLLAVGPPTIAMGMTLPLVTRAVVTRSDRVARQSGLLYALNILGAVVGALLAGFFLPPRLGIEGSIHVAVVVNVLVGVTALALGRAWLPLASSQPSGTPQEGDEPSDRRPTVSLIVAAAISGFGTLALEVVYIRILSQRTEASVYCFALMLTLFLLFLAAGSGWVAWRLDRTNPWRFLAWTQLAAVPLVLLSPVLFQWVPIVGLFGPNDQFAGRMVRLTLATGLLLGPTILLVGVVLPTTWKIAGRRLSSLGQQVGLLTGVNTLAAVAGSLTAGFVLLPRLGVAGSVLVIAPLYASVAVLGFVNGYDGVRKWVGCVACLAMWLGWLLFGPWNHTFQSLSSGETLISYQDGEAASVAVIERGNGHRIMKMNHEYVLGSSYAADKERRQGRLPLVLHPHPSRVAFIGVATGMTVSAATELPVEHVVAIELVPGVADAVDAFDRWNDAFYRDPRVEMVVDDGRNYLLGTADRFDVIVSDLFVPWHAGTGDLYSVEHFRIARQRLAPGGLFAQWLPGYQLSVEELRSIVASFLEVFSTATMWRNDFDAETPLVCLIGYRDAADATLDVAKIRRDCQHLVDTGRAQTSFFSEPASMALLFVCGDAELREWSRGAPLNTDDRPYIEFSTARSYYRSRDAQNREMLELLASLHSPVWPYAESLTTDGAGEKIFRAAELINDAELANRQKNYEKEFRSLSELVDVAGDVNAVAAYVIDAAGRLRQRRMTARCNELLRAVAGQPDPPLRAVLLLARGLQADGDDEEAIELYARAIELDPERTSVRRLLVALLTKTGRFEEAQPHLEKLVDADPEDAELRIDLAQALDRQGKTTEAAQQIEVFRKLDLGDKRTQLWARLRTLGLGSYVDRVAPENTDQP